VDVLAILPYFIEIIIYFRSQGQRISGITVIRILRLIRLLRLFRLSKDAVLIFARTMAASAVALEMLFLLLTLAMVFFAAILFYVERVSGC
jgi:hypothetical protein